MVTSIKIQPIINCVSGNSVDNSKEIIFGRKTPRYWFLYVFFSERVILWNFFCKFTDYVMIFVKRGIRSCPFTSCLFGIEYAFFLGRGDWGFQTIYGERAKIILKEIDGPYM